MLGFTAGSFLPRPGIAKIKEAPEARVELRKQAGASRFLVQRQGYLRNARRILEVGPKHILVLDLFLLVRTQLDVADVQAVKIGADEGSFTLQMSKGRSNFAPASTAESYSRRPSSRTSLDNQGRKTSSESEHRAGAGSEAFVCARRAELLCVLLPFVQRDVGGHLFSLRKWSKRSMFGEAPAPPASCLPGSSAPARVLEEGAPADAPLDGALRCSSTTMPEQVNSLAASLSLSTISSRRLNQEGLFSVPKLMNLYLKGCMPSSE